MPGHSMEIPPEKEPLGWAWSTQASGGTAVPRGLAA